MENTGKRIRLSRIMPAGRAVIVPFDDALINGPQGGLRDTASQVRRVGTSGADAILGYQKSLEACSRLGSPLPFIQNITASTVVGEHTRKVLVGTVEGALRLGADCVAVHVNVSDDFEADMLAALGKVSEQCAGWGMPLMAIMYPRRRTPDGDDNYLTLKNGDREAYADLIAHAARIAVELGADIVKTQYTGDEASFARVVDSSLGTPLVIAGGPLIATDQALENVRGAMAAGASGVCFGRNTYNRKDVSGFIRSVRDIVRGEPTGTVQRVHDDAAV